jgi:hypothetical protein
MPDSSTNKTDCHDIAEILLASITIAITLLGHFMYRAPYLYNANVNILLYIILGGYMYTFHVYTMPM